MNKRRKFLGYLTSIALLPFLPARTSAAPRLSGADNSPLIRILQELMPDNPATRALGTTALQHYKSAFVSEILPGRLFGSLTETPSPTAHQLRAHLQSLRDADFAAGATVALDGWILARSEAEAFAVVALHRKV
jgi:hypothetical protein